MSKRKLQIDKLKALRTRLKRTKDERFDMGSWVEHQGNDDHPIEVFDKGRQFCGTSACLAGHALALEYGVFGMDEYGRYYVSKHEQGARRRRIPEPGEAAAKLLGLPNERLFHSDAWPDEYKWWRRDTESERECAIQLLDAIIDGTIAPDLYEWEDDFYEDD